MDAHCVASLTHIQRLEALQELDGFSGIRGIIGIPDFVAGVTRREDWSTTTREKVVQAAEPYRREPLSRVNYFLGLARHRVVVSPTGYGELCYRHAEAMSAGAALICQDLSHVEMMYRIVNDSNAVFCRPDLGDLRTRVEYLLNAEDHRRRIARTGREYLARWSRNSRKHLYDGIARHIQDAIS